MKGLLAILAKGKGSDAKAKGPASDGDSESDYGSELADMLGIAEEDHEAFNDALAGFVRECMRKKAEPEDYEE